MWPPVEGLHIKRKILHGSFKGQELFVPNINVHYAESKDGVHWEKPNLGLCEFKGSKENNIILKSEDLTKDIAIFDCFVPFIDENPDCSPEKKYKALVNSFYTLVWFSSPDGIHWTQEDMLNISGSFDTMDICWYDKSKKKYVMYIRDRHERGTPMTVEDILNSPPKDMEKGIRDIRRTESEDFVHWTQPIPLTYENTIEDYQLYTNNIRPYYRNENILIGFPTRYTERQEWTENYDELCGKEERLEKMKTGKRLGLAVMDNIFMNSRDGYHWTRYDEAFFANERERFDNWIYGDGYWAYYMLETPSEDGNYKEISMFMPTEYAHGEGKPAYLTRYTLRVDGFACYTAPAKGAKVVTKPIIFDGTQMKINFSTSAYGNMYITIADKEGNSVTSCETFGNTDNRKVNFSKEILEQFKGKRSSSPLK